VPLHFILLFLRVVIEVLQPILVLFKVGYEPFLPPSGLIIFSIVEEKA
jgi:hypothetical protein